MHINYMPTAVSVQIYSPSLSDKLGILMAIKTYPFPPVKLFIRINFCL